MRRKTQTLPAAIATLDDSTVINSARDELVRGLGGKLRILSGVPKESAIVLGTLGKLPEGWGLKADLAPDGYWLKTIESGGVRYTVVTGLNDRGLLYGAFALLRKISLGETVGTLDERQSPAAPVRWVNQWDNLDGSIKRGYGGRSIFWVGKWPRPRGSQRRVRDYGRMCWHRSASTAARSITSIRICVC